jgi:hypothetical protein
MTRIFFAKHLWIIVLIVAGVIHATGFRPGHEWGADYAWNWALAVSLLNGTTEDVAAIGAFRLEHMPDLIVGPAVYPWGYPAILSVGHALWGDNIQMMKLYMLAFYVGGWAIFYLLIRDRAGPILAAMILALVAFGPIFSAEKDHLRSEAPFLLFFILSIYLMARVTKPGSLALLGFVIFWAYWTRFHGVTLLGTLLAYQILRQQFSIIPYLVFVACWSLTTLIPGDTSYLGSGHLSKFFSEPIPVIWHNAIYYLTAPGTYFDLPRPLRAPVGAALFALAAFGAWRRRREDLVLILACLAYASILMPYPFRQGRFLLPVLPFLLYFAAQGVPWPKIQSASVSAVAIACIGYTAFLWPTERLVIEGPYSPQAREFFQFVGTTPKDSVFLFWKPRSVTFYANRRAIMSNTNTCVADYIAIYDDASNKIAVKRKQILLSFVADRNPVFQNRKFRVFPNPCPKPS